MLFLFAVFYTCYVVKIQCVDRVAKMVILPPVVMGYDDMDGHDFIISDEIVNHLNIKTKPPINASIISESEDEIITKSPVTTKQITQTSTRHEEDITQEKSIYAKVDQEIAKTSSPPLSLLPSYDNSDDDGSQSLPSTFILSLSTSPSSSPSPLPETEEITVTQSLPSHEKDKVPNKILDNHEENKEVTSEKSTQTPTRHEEDITQQKSIYAKVDQEIAKTSSPPLSLLPPYDNSDDDGSQSLPSTFILSLSTSPSSSPSPLPETEEITVTQSSPSHEKDEVPNKILDNHEENKEVTSGKSTQTPTRHEEDITQEKSIYAKVDQEIAKTSSPPLSLLPSYDNSDDDGSQSLPSTFILSLSTSPSSSPSPLPETEEITVTQSSPSHEKDEVPNKILDNHEENKEVTSEKSTQTPTRHEEDITQEKSIYAKVDQEIAKTSSPPLSLLPPYDNSDDDGSQSLPSTFILSLSTSPSSSPSPLPETEEITVTQSSPSHEKDEVPDKILDNHEENKEVTSEKSKIEDVTSEKDPDNKDDHKIGAQDKNQQSKPTVELVEIPVPVARNYLVNRFI